MDTLKFSFQLFLPDQNCLLLLSLKNFLPSGVGKIAVILFEDLSRSTRYLLFKLELSIQMLLKISEQLRIANQ